jgi:hypothetical protein
MGSLLGPAGAVGGAIASFGAGITSGESGALSATAQGEAASYQAQVARNNATISGYNATEAEQAGEVQAQATSMQGAEAGAKVKTALAANNVDVNTGSAAKVEEGEREVNQLNTETVLNNANLAAYGYRNQAAAYTAQAGLETLTAGEASTAAGLAEEGGAFQAVAGLLGSASAAPSKFNFGTGGSAGSLGNSSIGDATVAGALY